MDYKYSCFICSKKVSRASKKAHLFSKAHQQDIWNAVLAKKEQMLSWIGRVENTIPGGATSIPYIRFGKDYKGYKVCFACKTLTPSDKVPPTFLHCPCDKTAENIQAIKDILENKQIQMPVGELPEDTAPASEVEKLKKRLAKVEAERDMYLELSEEADDYKNILGNVMRFVYGCDRDTFGMLLEKDGFVEDYMNETQVEMLWKAILSQPSSIIRQAWE